MPRLTGSPLPLCKVAAAIRNDAELSATPLDASKTHFVAPTIKLKNWKRFLTFNMDANPVIPVFFSGEVQVAVGLWNGTTDKLGRACRIAC